MKTFAQILFFFSLLISNAGYSNNGEEAINKEISNKLRKAVIMPESLKGKHGPHKVTVTFLVNEEGRVTEVYAGTKDREAKRDIENQFLQLYFNELSPCVRHSIDINFLFL